jgi:2'-5' RNA ligase
MDLLAVDVALLLPDEVRARAEALNRALWLARPDTLRLDERHIPHVTLVQQFVRYDNLAALAVRIETVLRGRAPLPLSVSGAGSSGDSVVLLIEPTPALRGLHEELIEACAGLEERDGDENAFYGADEPARPRDVAWVRHYRTDAAYDRFVPHITLGHGELPEPIAPFAFTADRVALCHLGRFCSCRVVLREWRLAPLE